MVASIKKGTKERGRPPFRRAWARGMKACGPERAPQDDITPPSSSLLFFPFISIPLSALGLASWISMAHACTAVQPQNKRTLIAVACLGLSLPEVYCASCR